MRDEFPRPVAIAMAARVRQACSNPDCRAATSGPKHDPHGAVNIGVAAHITAASAGGPRYDSSLTRAQRQHIDNGIWLCQNCAKLIDNDTKRFAAPILRAWKLVAEDYARRLVGKKVTGFRDEGTAKLELYLENENIDRDYYTRNPVRRFVLGLKNAGTGIAKFPAIRFSFSSGLSLDQFGIDGNYGTALPQAPSEQGSVAFRGGNDHVVHPDQLLKVTKLFQYGEDKDVAGISTQEYPNLYRFGRPSHHRWYFKAVNFSCEISAEGIPNVPVLKSFPEKSIVWPNI